MNLLLDIPNKVQSNATDTPVESPVAEGGEGVDILTGLKPR
jgi:hypothetical protein